MTDWTTHADALFDPGAPILGITGLETRDNFLALGEGSTGAPSIVPNYGKRANPGDVGTYVFARYTNTGNVVFGGSVAGSDLEPTSAFFGGDGGDLDFPTGNALTGTWRCYGRFTNEQDKQSGAETSLARGATLWLRVS